MWKRIGLSLLVSSVGLSMVGAAPPASGPVDVKKNRVSPEWEIHDLRRPNPPVVPPVEGVAPVPGGVTVLFDGHDLSKWKSATTDAPAGWVVRDGYAQVAGRDGIATTQPIGDCQLHVEWAAPTPAKGTGQERGNSGVFLMGLYEVQVLDSFHSDTYADGQAAAVYGQYPPLANACKPPGEWQAYDITWQGPRWDAAGTLTRPATVTVVHNGVLVQDHVRLSGPTAHHAQPAYEPHAERLPLVLQNHGNPVRFRNIWVKETPSDARN